MLTGHYLAMRINMLGTGSCTLHNWSNGGSPPPLTSEHSGLPAPRGNRNSPTTGGSIEICPHRRDVALFNHWQSTAKERTSIRQSTDPVQYQLLLNLQSGMRPPSRPSMVSLWMTRLSKRPKKPNLIRLCQYLSFRILHHKTCPFLP
jgi:hypothetical protein